MSFTWSANSYVIKELCEILMVPTVTYEVEETWGKKKEEGHKFDVTEMKHLWSMWSTIDRLRGLEVTYKVFVTAKTDDRVHLEFLKWHRIIERISEVWMNKRMYEYDEPGSTFW